MRRSQGARVLSATQPRGHPSSWSRANSVPPVNRLASTWGDPRQPLVQHPCDLSRFDGSDLLDSGEEVVRSPLRLCFRGGCSKILSSGAKWVLETATPVIGSTTGDSWQDLQIRLLRTSVRCSTTQEDDFHKSAQRWSTVDEVDSSEAIVLELTAPEIANASQFCFISVLTPSYFRRLQVEQRITVDWHHFVSLLAEMVSMCHDNAMNCMDFSNEETSANRSANGRSRPSSFIGGRICSLGPSDCGDSDAVPNCLEFSIIEPSSLREIVHLNLPVTSATNEMMQAHLCRVLEESKHQANSLLVSIEDIRSQMRTKESQWQRLDAMRSTTQSQRIGELDKQVKDLMLELEETKHEAKVNSLELTSKRSLADETLRLREENTLFKEELSISKPQLIKANESMEKLQKENKKLKDVMLMVKPEAVEELRMVCVNQKSLLTEFELEVAQHAQIYSSLNNKISQLTQDNRELQHRATQAHNRASELEEASIKHREMNLNEGTVSNLQKLEMRRLEMSNETLKLRTAEAESLHQKLSNDLRQKSQLVEYLHSELNKAQMLCRVQATPKPPDEDQLASTLSQTSPVEPKSVDENDVPKDHLQKQNVSVKQKFPSWRSMWVPNTDSPRRSENDERS
eukprot:GHVH01005734.1.p1 GENE.GHVH01005734.1~~GHVH01005734.1.p1  ORF type:complete len:628 (+),score=103.72 GHVH01005734.1:133-2016(+)